MTHETSSTNLSSSPEKRRHRRFPILQRAAMKFQDGPELRCQIRDYCPGGVYIHLANATSMKALERQIGTRVEIRFLPGHRDDAPCLRLDGTVVRVSHTGLGIAFDRPESSEALQALDEVAKAAQRPHDTAMAPNIKRACGEAFDHAISEILDHFFGRIQADLREAVNHAETGAEQTVYFDAMAAFQDVQSIANRFRDLALAQAGQYELAAKPDFDSRDNSRLSLVEKEVFEDWLNLRGEMGKLESAFDKTLRVLERRLARIAPVSIDAQNNPYGPAALGGVFRKVLEDLPLSNAPRQVIYSAFGQALQEVLGSLYEQLTTITAPLEIADFPRSARDSRRPPRPQIPATAEAAPSAEPNLRATGETPPAQAAAAMQTSNLSAAFAMLNQLSATSTAGDLAPVAKPAGWAQGLDYASKLFRNRLAEPQVHALHLVGAILGNIRTDSSIPGSLKPFFQQFQLPLLKLAIQDPKLMNDAVHPARRLLDALDLVALSADQDGVIDDRINQWLNASMANLVRAGDRDPSLLAHAAEDLEGLMAPLVQARDLRIERLREDCESQQRVDQAHRAVDAAIQQRLGGRSVPVIVPRLLEHGWRQWLILAFLRAGTDSPEWREGMAVLDRLLAWLSPESTPPDTMSAHRLIGFVEERLRPLCPASAVLQPIMDELTALLIQGRQPDWVSIPSGPPQAVPDAAALQRIRSFRTGNWLQVLLDSGGPSVPLLIVWISENTDRFVFVDRTGTKRLELSAQEFAQYLEQARAVRSESLELPLSERTIGGLMQTLQEKLRYHATHDSVTGLLNRKAFARWLDREFASDRNAAVAHVLCVMEIDQLRIVNHVCGPDAGDALLGKITTILKNALGHGVLLARLGDSHFGVLLHGCRCDTGRQKAEALLAAIRDHRFAWGEHSFPMAAYMGLVEFSAATGTSSAVLKQADAACLWAREKGGNSIQLFTEEDDSLSAQQQIMEWAGRIDRVLADNRLFVRCQKIAPIGRVATERPFAIGGTVDAASYYEVLLGIRDEQGRVISPTEFVAAAERWKRMTEIDRWQIESIFDWIHRRPERFAAFEGFSINLSGQSLNSDEFLDFLQHRLAEADWPLEKITFEITETAAIAEFGSAEKFIRQIRRYGCRFSLDDFGSGFSSYAYLKNLQVDCLKIDGSFIRDLAIDKADYALVKSMNEVGHSLGMKTIAEYVESEAILEKLRDIGVDYAQGYLVEKPISLEELL